MLAQLDIAALFASPTAPHLAAFILPSLVPALPMSFTLHTSSPVFDSTSNLVDADHGRFATKIVSRGLCSTCLTSNLAASPASGTEVFGPTWSPLALCQGEPLAMKIGASVQDFEGPMIPGGRTYQAAELAERPVGRGDRFGTAWDRERQAADVIGAGLDTEGLGLDGSDGGAFGSAAQRVMQRPERQVTLVVGAWEPFGRDPTDPLAAELSTLKPLVTRPASRLNVAP